MKSLLFFVCLFVSGTAAFSQNVLHSSYSDTVSSPAITNLSSILLADSGFVLAGTSGSAIVFVRTDRTGDTLWTKQYLPVGTASFSIAQLCETANGGFVLAGTFTDATASSSDMMIIRTDANGVPQWSKRIGGLGDETGKTVTETSSGDFVLAGFQGSLTGAHRIYLARLDAAGGLLWTKLFAMQQQEAAVSVSALPNDAIALLSSSGAGSILQRVEANGTVAWSNTIYGLSTEVPSSLLPGPAGSVYFCCKAPGLSAVLIRADSAGTGLWRKAYTVSNTSGAIYPEMYLGPAGDSAFTLSGYEPVSVYNRSVFFSVDVNGLSGPPRVINGMHTNKVYGKRYSYSYTLFPELPAAFGLVQSPGGNNSCISIGGAMDSEPLTVPVTAAVNFIVTNCDTLASFTMNLASFLCQADTSCGSLSVFVEPHVKTQFACTILPQPNTGMFTLQFSTPLNGAQLEITDVSGRTILIREDVSGNSIQLNDPSLRNGLYFYSLRMDGELLAAGKIISE